MAQSGISRQRDKSRSGHLNPAATSCIFMKLQQVEHRGGSEVRVVKCVWYLSQRNVRFPPSEMTTDQHHVPTAHQFTAPQTSLMSSQSGCWRTPVDLNDFSACSPYCTVTTWHYFILCINSEVRAEKKNVRKSKGGSEQALFGFTIIHSSFIVD